MKRISLAAAVTLAAALAVALMPGAAAGTSTSTSTTNLSCNDGTNLNLALDSTTLTDLTGAVNAIDTYPAGSPALSCSLSDPSANSTPTTNAPKKKGGGNGPQDFAVGGGQTLTANNSDNCTSAKTENFALSAHVPAGTISPAGGTFNLSCSGGVNNGGGNLTSKITCLELTSSNTADFHALVTHADGVFKGYTELFRAAMDNGLPSGTVPDTINWSQSDPGGGSKCSNVAPSSAILHGNITVRQGS